MYRQPRRFSNPYQEQLRSQMREQERYQRELRKQAEFEQLQYQRYQEQQQALALQTQKIFDNGMTHPSVQNNMQAQQELLYNRAANKLNRQYNNLQQKQFEMRTGIHPSMLQLPRLTKATAESFIAHYLGVAEQNIKPTKLDEDFEVMRHACIATGVAIITPSTILYGDTQIKFGVCPKCGVIHYFYEKE